MPKPNPFLTYDQQIDKLTNEKHIIINDELNITVRQSRQSGVARATCPD